MQGDGRGSSRRGLVRVTRYLLESLQIEYWSANQPPDAGVERPIDQACTFAVNSIPSAFITAIVVFSVGLPFSLNDRYNCSRDNPVSLAICAIPFARATTPSACAI